jgi:hypothetical protein
MRAVRLPAAGKRDERNSIHMCPRPPAVQARRCWHSDTPSPHAMTSATEPMLSMSSRMDDRTPSPRVASAASQEGGTIWDSLVSLLANPVAVVCCDAPNLK